MLSAAQLRREQMKQERERERIRDMDAIEQAIKEESGALVSQKRLEELFNGVASKYEGHMESFKFEFLQSYVRPKERRDLPRILYVHKSFIHRDRVFPLFQARLQETADALRAHYIKEMGFQLKTNNRERRTVFYSRSNFEADVGRLLPQFDPLLTDLLNKPTIVAEAGVHTAKQKKLAQSVDDLKSLMQRYFEPGTMKFKDMLFLFQLNMLEIFDHAFPRLSLVRQIVMRISGRYRGYREQYLEESRRMFSGSAGNRPHAGPRSAAARPKETGTRRGAGHGNAGHANAGHGKPSRPAGDAAKRKTPKKPRYYSEKDRDQAWEEFKNNLGKG
jgi:hypothetical protein